MFRLTLTPAWRLGLLVASLSLCLGLVSEAWLLQRQHRAEQAFWQNLPIDVLQRYRYLQAQHQQFSDEAVLIRHHFMSRPEPDERNRLLWLILSSLLIGGCTAAWAWRMLLRPLDELEEAAERMTSGDYGVRSREDALGELGRVQSAFNMLAGQLARLESERKELIASISHELRTPLTILQGRLHALCDGVLTGNAREHQRLLDQVLHLVRLVDDLNVIAQGQGQRLSLHQEELDLQTFLHDFIPIFAERAQALGMQIQCHTQSAYVLADVDRMRQVLTNLIENAMRYAASGGTLDIDMQVHDGRVEILVSDRGPGLPDWQDERVFGAFIRVDTSRNRHTGGAGLGLAVVRTLVELHGGQVFSRQREGGGAQFVISLPQLSH